MNRIAILVTLTLFVTACSDDSKTPAPSPDLASVAAPADMTPASTSGNGKISGQVRYAGTKTGTLKFALYDQQPGPTTPPKYFMFPTVANPTFPYAYTLDAVAPGSYYVVVILDVPPANPAIPGPEDPVGVSMGEVTVVAGQTATTDVTLPAGGDM
jgi:hypothetical protein